MQRRGRGGAKVSFFIRVMARVDPSVGMVDVHVRFQRGGANLQQIATSPCESVIIPKSDLVEGQGQSWVFAPETDKRAAEAGQRGVKSYR